VSLYLAVAFAVALLGFIPKERTFARVGPRQVPGFFRVQEPQKRLEDAEFVLSQLELAVKRDSLADVSYGQLKPRVDLEMAEVEAAWQLYDALIVIDDRGELAQHLPQVEAFESEVAALFQPLSAAEQRARNFELWLGTDVQGRSIAIRAFYSIEVAIKIGLVVAFFSVVVGALLGVAAGFYGGWVDHLVTWLFTTFSSIPSLVLLVLLAHVFTGTWMEGTLWPMYIAFSATYWIGPCRVIRGETLKLRELEYVQAATALGFRPLYIMVRHILPNASHLMLINFSLLFIAAIKGEVILTYLGLGIKNGTSWGIMIEQSRPEVIDGFFWQIGSATALMFGLVLAFNILSDALQDAFDPKHVS